MSTPAERALALAMRYARIQRRICELGALNRRLLGSCENGRDDGCNSGCLCKLADAKQKGLLDYGHEGAFSDLRNAMVKLDFCVYCFVAMKVFKYRTRVMSKRRSKVLSSIKRLGATAARRVYLQAVAEGSP